MQSVLEFFGRFHPLVVHLPIGILMIAVLFDLLSWRYKRFAALAPAVPLLYLFGALGAVGACISGYLLSLSGEYGGSTLVRHQWTGILTAALGWLVYYLHTQKKAMPLLAVLLVVVLSIAGHFGGSLTHGSDYLIAPLKGESQNAAIELENPAEAIVYQDIVVPIFSESCYPCHNADKQKGKLRLDSPEWIAKGGKSGAPMLVSDSPAEGELLRRIHLPESDEEHMPSSEKYALRPEYLTLLTWWMEQGASFEAKVQALEMNEEVEQALAALQTPVEAASDYPAVDLAPPDAEVIRKLKATRATVLPVADNTNLLSLSLINVDTIDGAFMTLVEPIASHIAWLRCSDGYLTTAALSKLANFKHLTKLYLDDTNIEDAGLQNLMELPHLSYLNLKGTAVSSEGIRALEALPALKQLFIYQTATSPAERQAILQALPEVAVDTGGYQVPTLVTDTTFLGG